MILATDPLQLRSIPVSDMVRAVSSAGFEAIELSPREGLREHRSEIRPDSDELRKLRDACRDFGVSVASVFTVQPWASGDPQEREAAVRGLKVAIETARELGCHRINTELTGNPHEVETSRASFLRSIDDLRPTLDELDVHLAIEPHPYDFLETNEDAVDLIAGLDCDRIGYLFCAPHIFHLGSNVAEMLEYAGPYLRHVHLADTFRPQRYILNPPSESRIHQHLEVGQGEIDWVDLVQCLDRLHFDGVATISPFAWEDDAVASLNRNRVALSKLLKGTSLETPYRPSIGSMERGESHG